LPIRADADADAETPTPRRRRCLFCSLGSRTLALTPRPFHAVLTIIIGTLDTPVAAIGKLSSTHWRFSET